MVKVKEKKNLTGKIAFLIAGGTALSHESPLKSSISSQAEAAEWLAPMEPFLLGTKIEPKFFYDGEGLDMPQGVILEMGKFVVENYDKYDGFVVTAGLAMVARVAAGMAFLLDSVGKPVVVTGTPVSYHNQELNAALGKPLRKGGEFGARSNILGACQVAVSDLGEVCAAYGNKLLWPTRLVASGTPGLNFFDSKDMPSLGRVDFGIRLFAARPRREAQPQAILAWNDKVAEVDATGPLDTPAFLQQVEGAEAVIIRSFHGELPLPVREIAKGLAKKIPVILHTQVAHEQEGDFIWIEGITSAALAAKVRWALGQEKGPAKFASLLREARANEFWSTQP